jgi:hypothetical protein
MMRYLNRWSLSGFWVGLMLVAWPVLVPDGLAVGTWILTTAAGPVLFVGVAMFWAESRPTPSVGQARVTVDAGDEGARRRS